MNMLRLLAKQNMKYYKKRNILIGIAVFLTSFLVFAILSVGVVFQHEQYAAINAYNPSWHGKYTGITEDMAAKIASNDNVGMWGIYTDTAFTEISKRKKVVYSYADGNALDMMRISLDKGRMPESENEIALDPGAAERLGKTVEVGGRITLPYQVYRNGKKDYIQEGEFIVTGLLKAVDSDIKEYYQAIVSKELLEKEVPPEQVFYQFLFRIPEDKIPSTNAARDIIENIAKEYGIHEDSVKVNSYNLAANYADPDMYMVIFVIICIVAFAGSITIYSIYYIGTIERIKEYGRLKAAGMTSRELKKIVLWEGTGIVKRAAPAGIVAGIIIEVAGIIILHSITGDWLKETREYISYSSLIISHIGIMALAYIITYITMYISIRKPVRLVGKITEMEAISCHSAINNRINNKKKKSVNKVNISHLVKNNLASNKKRSIATILAMSATGILVMVMSTVISCTDSRLEADDMCHGHYMLRQRVEFNNEEHKEREWQNVVSGNPFTQDFLEKIKKLDGVKGVDCFDSIYTEIKELYSGKYEIIGVPEENKSFIMDNIIEGSVSYEELESGDKLVVDSRAAKWWFGGLKPGDKITYTTEIDGKVIEKQAEIAATGDFPIIFPGFYTASRGFEDISSRNLCSVLSIWGEEEYNKELADKLLAIEEEDPLLMLSTWQEQYEIAESNTLSVTVFFSIFLGILGLICVMNMVNTMISSVQRRKREIGMMQAVGMTDRQLFKMLQTEGGFYIFGTLFITIAGGGLMSYPVYRLAKEYGILGVHKYQFPFGAVFVISCILAVLEVILVAVMSHSVKKEAIIDRIRFNG